MKLRRVSDIVEASRVPEFCAKNDNGNTLRVVHSLDEGADPKLDEFDMVCYSLHGGSHNHTPRRLRKAISLRQGSVYRDYFEIEKDYGANEMAEAFVHEMRQQRQRVLCVFVRPPRGAFDCNRPTKGAVKLNLGSRELTSHLRQMHDRIINLLFQVRDVTQNRRVATIDFHTMAPKSTEGIDKWRRIRARRKGQPTPKMAMGALPAYNDMWCNSCISGTPRPLAVLYKAIDGSHVGNHEFAMAVKGEYMTHDITVVSDDPYYANATFPGAILMQHDGFHFEAPKHLVTKDQKGHFDLKNCEGDPDKARELVQPLVHASCKIIGERAKM